MRDEDPAGATNYNYYCLLYRGLLYGRHLCDPAACPNREVSLTQSVPRSFKSSRGGRLVGIEVGVAGIDKYSTTVVLAKYCGITTFLLLE